jgi:hypothetical protein
MATMSAANPMNQSDHDGVESRRRATLHDTVAGS